MTFTVRKEHCHTMLSLHGSGYFKLLDDTAFFAAQGVEQDNFIFTTSFNTYIVRPVPIGATLKAIGKVTNASKSLIIAESEIRDENGKLVASGSGTFMKSPFPLSAD